MLPLSVRIENVETGETTAHVFRQSPVQLGRNPLNQLPLKDLYTSTWHGILRFDERRIEYVDLGSRNGTIIDGARAEKNVALPVTEHTDLRVGKLRLHLSRRATLDDAQAVRNRTQFGMLAVDLRSAVVAKPLSVAPPPPPPPGDPGPHGLGSKLLGPYEAFIAARKVFFDELRGHVDTLPGEQRAAELSALAQRMPDLAQEESFQALLRQHGGAPKASAAVKLDPPPQEPPGTLADPSSSRVFPLVKLLAQTYAPRIVTFEPSDVEPFLNRVSEVLESFGKAFVELRRGQEEFGTEMAVQTTRSEVPIRDSTNSQEVLSYFLDWTAEGNHRVQTLSSSFADVMIHQVAVLTGVREGIRALVTQLSPERLASGGALALKGPPAGWRQKVWPFGTLERWKKANAAYQDFFEEEARAQSLVFGVEFARAYSIIAGGKPHGEPGAPDV